MASTRSKKKASTAPHLVEPKLKYITDATFAEFHTAIARGFQEEPHPELKPLDQKIFDKKRMFGFKVGRRWVATCGDFERELTVPGGAAVPTAAVTVVTVHPPYRRRGLLTRDDGAPARAGREAGRAAGRAVGLGVPDLRPVRLRPVDQPRDADRQHHATGLPSRSRHERLVRRGDP